MKLKIIKGNEKEVEREFNKFSKENKIIKVESNILNNEKYFRIVLMVYY